MAPLTASPTKLLAKRYYYYSYGDSYYKGRMIGIIVGCIIFVTLIAWYVAHRHRKNKRLAASGPLLYGPGGALSPISLLPPPYSGPPEQAPIWNGTQWQGPKELDGSEGPYWNGLNWCKESGPVWNGVTWVNAGPVNGIFVPMNKMTGKVWNGKEWIGGWPANVSSGSGRMPHGHVPVPRGEQASGVEDWHKRDLEGGVQVPAPAYTGEETRGDAMRRDGVNADGGLGHVATQSRDFAAPKHNVTATTTVAPEVKDEKESGFKRLLKSVKGVK